MADTDVKRDEDQPVEERRPNLDQAPDHTPIQSPAPAGYRPGDDPVEAKRELARRRRTEAWQGAVSDEPPAPRDTPRTKAAEAEAERPARRAAPPKDDKK